MKDFGADALSHYPSSPTEELTPLHAAACCGNLKVMDFLISGTSMLSPRRAKYHD